MKLEISEHAKERMAQYGVNEQMVLDCILTPDDIDETYGNRQIYQKRLNGYVLRAIVETKEGIKRVVTVYKARSGRYGI